MTKNNTLQNVTYRLLGDNDKIYLMDLAKKLGLKDVFNHIKLFKRGVNCNNNQYLLIREYSLLNGSNNDGLEIQYKYDNQLKDLFRFVDNDKNIQEEDLSERALLYYINEQLGNINNLHYLPKNDDIDYSKNYNMWLEITKITRFYNINSAYIVGSASYMIKNNSHKFVDFEEFMNYYLTTGVKSHSSRLSNKSKYFKGYNKKQDVDNNAMFDLYGKNGRTLDEIVELSTYLMNRSRDKNNKIKYKTLKYATKQDFYKSLVRLILLHTYNGIMVRENNTLNLLNEKFSNENIWFEQLDNDSDIYYSTDLVLKSKDGVILGIQVKPTEYLNNSRISEYDKNNQLDFKNKYNLDYDVLYVFSELNGFMSLDSYLDIKEIINELK